MLQNTRIKEEHFFLTAYTLWLIDALFSITMWNDIAILCTIGNYMQKLAYMLLIAQFLIKRTYTKRDAMGLFLIVGSAAIACHSIYNDTFMSAMIFIYFASDVDFKKLLRQTVIVQGVFMAVTIAAAAFGLIENTLWDVGGGRFRYALGYKYCAYSAHILLFITLAWVSMREKITIAETAVLLGLNTALYVLTDSKTDYFLCLLALAGYGVIWFLCKRGEKPRLLLLDMAAKYGCGLVTVFSVLLHALYREGNPVWMRLNGWLNNRLQLGYTAIHEYGFSLFGKAVRWYGMGSLKKNPALVYNYVDCAYLKLLIEAGIVLVLVMIAGFYFVGRKLAEARQYYLIWSLLIAFAYGIVNVHVTVVSFGGLILVLSILFKRRQEDAETDIAGAFGSWTAGYLSDRLRGILRIMIIFVILIVSTFVQTRDYGYIIKYDSLYRYIAGLLILLLSACTWERTTEKTYSKTWLYYGVWVFLIAAMLADFVVDRQFGYAAFSMLLFGGIFCQAWKGMREPERLVKDFRLAYKLYFLVSVLICIITRPVIQGKCYHGLFSNPSDQAVTMLAAYVLCIIGVFDAGWGGVNAIGSMVALYFIYRSGQPLILLIAILITIIYLFRKIYLIIRARQERRLVWMAVGFVTGIMMAWGLRYILTEITWGFGLQMEYADEQLQEFMFGGMALFTANPWIKLLKSMCSNYRKHIRKFNLMGHKAAKKIKKVPAWAPSSIITNGYRYGVIAGIAYIGLLFAFLKQAIQGYIRERNMDMAALGAAMVLCCMVSFFELPFMHIGWFVFYFVVCYFLVQQPESDTV